MTRLEQIEKKLDTLQDLLVQLIGEKPSPSRKAEILAMANDFHSRKQKRVKR